jgi:hypothetical protein
MPTASCLCWKNSIVAFSPVAADDDGEADEEGEAELAGGEAD